MDTKIQDLQAVIERIKKAEGIVCGTLDDVGHLRAIRRENEKWLRLPEEFYTLAREINGIRSDSAELYALSTGGKSGYFTDVVKSNPDALSSGQVVLGETEYDDLVYIPAQKRYELQDRISETSVAIFSTLAEALVYLFGV